MTLFWIGLIGLSVSVWAIALFRFRLTGLWKVTAFLNTLQLGWAVLPVGPQLMWGVLSGPSLAVQAWRSFRNPACLAILVSVLCQLVALFYSPSLELAGRSIVANGLFLLALLAAVELHKSGSDPLSAAARVILPLALPHAVATILFELDSDLKLAYLQSRVASVLVGPGVDKLFTTEPNNVLYSFKSGGLFFVNANMSSLFLGVFAVAAFAEWRTKKSNAWLAYSLVAYLSVFFTGSKTGIALALLVPLFVYFALRLTSRRGNAVPMVALLVLSVPVVLTVVQLLNVVGGSQIDPVTGQVNDPSEMADVRLEIWSPAVPLFESHPLAGLGFGGWENEFVRYVDLGSQGLAFPPHNFFLAAWADAGLLNALALIFFVGYALKTGVSTLKRPDIATRDRTRVAWCMGAAIWITVHGMGDNTFVYGTATSSALAAAAFGLLVAGPYNLEQQDSAAVGRYHQREHALVQVGR